jgi:hypothetical protein
MAGLSFTIHIGGLTAASDARASDLDLLGLVCELAIGGAGGRCAIELAASAADPPAAGDEVTVSLDGGAGATQVFTGQVQEVQVGPSTLRVTAVDGLALLARVYVESTYEQVSAGFIVKDLLGSAELTPGQIDEGPTFPRYFVHRGPRALAHVHRLAELCGAEVFAAGDGRVHFRAPADGPADHVFRYREHVLDLDVLAQPPVHAGVVVYGEGAASKAGADKAHVLVTDLDSVKGTAGDDGAAALHVVDGAVRTGDDATRLARAQLAQIQSRPVRGALTVLPAPQVQLGDRVGIDDLPSDHRAAPALAGGKALRVRSVRHTLRPGAGQGFTTRLGF